MRFGLFASIVACCIFVANRLYEYQSHLWNLEVQQTLEKLRSQSAPSVEALNAQLQQIGQLILIGSDVSKPSVGVYYWVAAMVAGILGSIAMASTEYTPSSFVVLTNQAENRRRKVIQREKYSILAVFWSYVATVMSGLIASLVYSYFT